jgi:hypothetical protein
MKYTTHNDTSKGHRININGTCLQGYIVSTYQKLVQLFGEPTKGDEYKVDAEWIIRFPCPTNEVSDQANDGIVCTIYNWKNGKAYCGEGGEEVANIVEWNVGGHSKKGLWMLMEILEGNPDDIEKKRLQDEIKELKRERDRIRATIAMERGKAILELRSAIKIIDPIPLDM